MSNLDWEEVSRLFAEVVDLPFDQAAERLQQLCGDRAELRNEIESLLKANHSRDSGFMDDGPFEGVATEAIEQLLSSKDKLPTDQPISEQSSKIKVPRRMGSFELLEELGRGGMGIVYRAREAELNRDVALKVILESQFATEADIDRFVHEAKTIAGLDHPHLIDVFRLGRDGDEHFFTMRLIEGSNLRQWASREPRSFSMIAEVCQKISEGVGHAHDRQIVHRDLKPENILVDGENQPVVTDFGLARGVTTASCTKTLGLIGTLAYAAPERFDGDGGINTDVYSLGAVIYELLCDRPPHVASTPAQLYQMILTVDPIPPRRLNPSIPQDLETICMHCLQRDPSHRYGSGKAIAEDLGRFLVGKPIMACPPSFTDRTIRAVTRRPLVTLLGLAVAVLAMLTVGGIGFAVASAKNTRRAQRQAFEAMSRSVRTRGGIGQRVESLEYLRLAKQTGVVPDSAGRVTFRNEVIESLSLPDLEELLQLPATSLAAFDRNLERMALVDEKGRVTLKRVDGKGASSVVSVDGQPIGLALSPDGQYLGVLSAIFGTESTHFLNVWATDNLKEPVFANGICGNSWHFSSDSRELVAGLIDGRLIRIRLGEEDSPRVVMEGTWNNSVALSSDSRWIALATAEPPYVSIHDASDGTFQQSLEHPSAVRCLSWGQNDELLAAGYGTEVRLWDTATGKLSDVFKGHDSVVSKVCFGEHGQVLASHSWDGQLRLWDSSTGAELLAFAGESWMTFSETGSRLAGVRWKGRPTIARLLFNDHYGLRSLPDSADPELEAYPDRGSWCVDFSPVYSLYAATHIGGVTLFSTTQTEAIAQLPIGHCTACRFVSDGSGFITSGKSGVLFWPLHQPANRGTSIEIGWPGQLVSTPEAKGHRLALADSAKRFAFVDQDRKSVHLFNLDVAEEIPLPPVDGGVDSISLDRNGEVIAIGTWKQNAPGVKMLDRTHDEFWQTVTSADDWPLLFPDGSKMVLSSELGYQILDARKLSRSRSLASRSASAGRSLAAVSHDGALLAINDSARSVRLLDALAGVEVAQLRTQDRVSITSLAISDDYRWLAAACQKNQVRLWNLGSLQKELESYGAEWKSFQVTTPSVRIDEARIVSRDESLSLYYPEAFRPADEGFPLARRLILQQP